MRKFYALLFAGLFFFGGTAFSQDRLSSLNFEEH